MELTTVGVRVGEVGFNWQIGGIPKGSEFITVIVFITVVTVFMSDSAAPHRLSAVFLKGVHDGFGDSFCRTV